MDIPPARATELIGRIINADIAININLFVMLLLFG